MLKITSRRSSERGHPITMLFGGEGTYKRMSGCGLLRTETVTALKCSFHTIPTNILQIFTQCSGKVFCETVDEVKILNLQEMVLLEHAQCCGPVVYLDISTIFILYICHKNYMRQ